MSRITDRWARVLDSDRGRAVVGSRAVRRIRSSGIFVHADRRRLRMVGSLIARRIDIAGIRTCALMIGHTKSGGSVLGACLDAHPRASIADEFNVPRHLHSGFSRDEMIGLMARNSRREAIKGRVTARRIEAYSLAIPGGSQGTFDALSVVGDANAGPTTRQLGDRPEAVTEIADAFWPITVRWLHLVRHPEGPVASMRARSGRTIDDGLADYAEQCRRLDVIRDAIPAGALHVVHYEDLVDRPRQVLGEVRDFLGLDPLESHLDAGARLVQSRDSRPIEWTDDQRRTLEGIYRTYSWMGRYDAVR